MLVHAVQMVRKNLKNYALLSVTVVLSFSGLLAYLMYTDSSLYNNYKEILSRDSHVIYISNTANDRSKEWALLDALSEQGLQSSYIRQQIFSRSAALDETYLVSNTVFVIPSHVWGIYEAGNTRPYEVTWLDGRTETDISLGMNEIVIPRGLYQLLGMDQKDTPVYELWLQAESSSSSGDVYFPVECTVTGLIEDNGEIDWYTTSIGQQIATFPVYVSQTTVEVVSGNAEPTYTVRDLLLYTSDPAAAVQRIDQLGLDHVNTYSLQQNAYRELQLRSQTKAIIALALFILLTINLYGCFMNTLERRKFEVGVKRAIGASGGAIMGQFLLEGIIVMLCNLLLSVVLVVDGFLVYKYIWQRINGEPWTITLSGASIGMFVGVGICLTLLFSALFAYKSTQVEVIQQLKAE